MPDKASALPGRQAAIMQPGAHYVNGRSMAPPFPDKTHSVLVGMGCFWGAEKTFWSLDGVYVTAVGYAGGFTPNPTYEEVCSGLTGHNEVVLIVYEPEKCSFDQLMTYFWENHDPTQGMRQGNDIGTQYRSGIYCENENQQKIAAHTMQAYAKQLHQAGFNEITTEIMTMPEFYYAEEYHQQYLAKNPMGYCGLGGTGVKCSMVKEV